MTVKFEGDFVVFLIGMRINKWWKFHKWIPVAMAMPKMLAELKKNPESGFLGHEIAGPGLIVQYWRSMEQLHEYATNRNALHYPAWKAFNKKIRSNGDVGIWHESFKVQAGNYECVYNNMPARGLGKVGTLVPAVGNRKAPAE